MKRFLFRPQQQAMSSPVFCGSNILDQLLNGKLRGQYTSVVTVVDSRVWSLHRKGLLQQSIRDLPIFKFPRGERYKSEQSLLRILHWLHDLEVDRKGLLIGIGGGVVTDIAGLAASCYKRGIDYLAVPTTLVGQVDAAIGGKTAINLGGSKNIVGTVYPPRMVVCDSQLLATLGRNHLRDGIIEALKLFAVRDRRRLIKYAARIESLLSGEGMEPLVADAVAAKLAVVNADPFEKGLRQVLNFGHTAGHAVEAAAEWTHGKSVAFGILLTLELSRRLAGMRQSDFDLVWQAVSSVYPRYDVESLTAHTLWNKIKHDKKRTGQQVNFVLLPKIGSHHMRPVSFAQFNVALTVTKRRLQG